MGFGEMPKKTVKKSVTSAGGKGGQKDSLFQKSPRNFRIGGDIQPKRNLTRFVKWPICQNPEKEGYHDAEIEGPTSTRSVQEHHRQEPSRSTPQAPRQVLPRDQKGEEGQTPVRG